MQILSLLATDLYELLRVPFSLLGIELKQLQLVYIILFFAISGVAIFADHDRVKKVSVIMIVVIFLLPGLVGITTYPFYQWHTFAWDSTPESTSHYFYASDSQGNELILDKRSDPLFIGAMYQGYSARMPSYYDKNEQKDVAEYIIKQTIKHQQSVVNKEGKLESVTIPWRHPPGESAPPRWSKSDLEDVGKLDTLRVYQITTKTSEGGKVLLEKNRELMTEYKLEQDMNVTITKDNT